MKKNNLSHLNTGVKKIVFYFRKGVIAKGDFALYYCIASQIIKSTDYEIYCVNNSNPDIQRQYLDSGIKFCELTKQNIKAFEGATFITAFNQIFFMLEELAPLKNAKLLFLFLHPQIYTWTSWQVSSNFNFNSVFKMLILHNAYGFMDRANLLAVQKNSRINFEKRYFPVIVNDIDYTLDSLPVINKNEINITWFGRLDSDKINSLLNFLDNLIGFDFGKPITIHLIGDGNAKDRIKLNKYAPQMRFVFNSYMYGEEKDKYLRENTDLVIAMGICALDAAALRIPTVLPIVSNTAFRSNKYVLFCDTKEYCLGSNEEDIIDMDCETHTADKIVKMIYTNNNKEILGQKCYECAVQNFTIDKQFENYLHLIENTSLTLNTCLKNPSIQRQLTAYKLFKRVFPKKTYSDFLLLRQRLNRFNDLSFKSKIKKVISFLIKRWSRHE